MSGVFQYFYYYFMIKAFQASASTVILPFLQVSALVITKTSGLLSFLASSFYRLFQGKPMLEKPKDLACFLFLFLGGLLPAMRGQLGNLRKKEFWRQKFMKFALLAGFCNSIYSLSLSAFENDQGTRQQFSLVKNFEFFSLTRYLFLLSKESFSQEFLSSNFLSLLRSKRMFFS